MPSNRFKRQAQASTAPLKTPGDGDIVEDYMSSGFLAQERVDGDGDVLNKAKRKKNDPPEPNKKITELMSEARSQGLETGLGSDNKGAFFFFFFDPELNILKSQTCNLIICSGFQMLAKMGFKQGAGLGKDEAGRADPLAIVNPTGRAGLGLAEAKARQDATTMQAMREHEKTAQQAFGGAHKARFHLRRLLRVAKRASAAVRDLDERLLSEAPARAAKDLWPPELNEVIPSCPENETAELKQVNEDPEGNEYVKPLQDFWEVPSTSTCTEEASGDPDTPLGPTEICPSPWSWDDLTVNDLELRLLRCVEHLRNQHGWSLLRGCSTSDLRNDEAAPVSADTEVSMLLEDEE